MFQSFDTIFCKVMGILQQTQTDDNSTLQLNLVTLHSEASTKIKKAAENAAFFYELFREDYSSSSSSSSAFFFVLVGLVVFLGAFGST